MSHSDFQDLFPAQAVSTRHFAAGTILIREGETGNSMYFIVSGQVEVLKADPKGNKAPVRLGILGPHDIFGEIGVLSPNHERTATVQTLTPCDIVVLSSEFLQMEIQKLSPAMQLMLQTLLSRMRETNWCLLQSRLKGLQQITHPYEAGF